MKHKLFTTPKLLKLGTEFISSVKRKEGISGYFAKLGMVLLIGLLFFVGLMAQQQLLTILAIGLGCFSAFYLFPKFHTEYEYIFCDGQIDFDRISGGESRKTILKIDMDNVELMAPENAHELDKYKNSDMKVRDFSSHMPDTPDRLRTCGSASSQACVLRRTSRR